MIPVPVVIVLALGCIAVGFLIGLHVAARGESQ